MFVEKATDNILLMSISKSSGLVHELVIDVLQLVWGALRCNDFVKHTDGFRSHSEIRHIFLCHVFVHRFFFSCSGNHGIFVVTHVTQQHQ